MIRNRPRRDYGALVGYLLTAAATTYLYGRILMGLL